jgi:CHASE2 domain-containing sensor protein
MFSSNLYKKHAIFYLFFYFIKVFTMTLSNKQLKIYHWLLSFTLTLLLLAHTAGQITIPTLQRIENILYDLRLRTTMPNTLDERIVILDIGWRQ